MTEAVQAAETYVNIEFYIMAWDDVTDPLFTALAAAADRGVTVRMLYDHLGSRGLPVYKDFVKRLSATKIDWHPMLPIMPLKGKFRRPDLRNHRKLMVVDGKVGFTGSLNVTERGYNKPKNHKAGREWVELMMRLHGPVVAALDAVFAGDWYAETNEMLDAQVIPVPEEPAGPNVLRNVECQIVPSGPGFVTENNLRLFTTLLYQAKKRISLTSPYFVPDESLLYAVTSAVQRGIPVELFVSEQSDQFMVGHAQALVLSGAARGRCHASTCIRRRGSCTRSSSRSTTIWRSSAPATWTCARSLSTTRSRRCWSVRRSPPRCGRSRTCTASSPGR